MAVVTSDYCAAIAHLPAGATLRVDGVSWEDYEQLLADLGEGYAARIFYDRGRLEIVTPTPAHEKAKGVIHSLVIALRDELDVDVESLGSMTLKRQMKARGAEPDECFYVQNAAQIIGRDDLDLAHDPPPDVVVEVERTSASLDKFAIYAALGVPEIWRVSQRREVHIHRLVGDRYESSAASAAFPLVTAEALTTFLDRGLAEGTRRSTRAFRAWLMARHGTGRAR